VKENVMMGVFDERKKRLLEGLQSEEPDFSPKGKPDEEILELIALINGHTDYVTTSSCSGRAVVFLEAYKSVQDQSGKGRWLMTSHSRLDEQLLSCANHQSRLFELFFGQENLIDADISLDVLPHRLVTLKFEPLVSTFECHSYSHQIIHVLCRDLKAASNLLHVAVGAGYRESGISVSALESVQEKVLVAVRTTAIRAEVPLASYSKPHHGVVPFNGVSHAFLACMIHIINDKFEENERRKQKLFLSLKQSFEKQNNSEPKMTSARLEQTAKKNRNPRPRTADREATIRR
jgi:tRNA wybutosine-synthesizing protein 3